MGGAPPLPHDFAPQGVKNWRFLAPGGRGWEGGREGPQTLSEGAQDPLVARRRPPGAEGGGPVPGRGRSPEEVTGSD